MTLTNDQLKMLAGLEGQEYSCSDSGTPVGSLPTGLTVPLKYIYSHVDDLLRVVRKKCWDYEMESCVYGDEPSNEAVLIITGIGCVDHNDPDPFAALFGAIEKAVGDV